MFNQEAVSFRAIETDDGFTFPLEPALFLIFTLSTAMGVLRSESAVLGATNIRNPKGVILFFNGCILFDFIGHLTAQQQLAAWRTITFLLICCSVSHGVSAVIFLIGCNFHQLESRNHIQDPFFLVFNMTKKMTRWHSR